MAALRIFARSAIATIRSPLIAGDSWKKTFPAVNQIQQRWVSITIGTGTREKEIELPDFEVTKDPKEWSYVEWALREKIIPKAPTELMDYSSGWKPQSPSAKSLPYFVDRTKNHMQPVYYRRTIRGMRRVTHIRRIQGDIFRLEKEMKQYVEEKLGKKVGSQINEPAGLIKFRGDCVAPVLKFLDSKGF